MTKFKYISPFVACLINSLTLFPLDDLISELIVLMQTIKVLFKFKSKENNHINLTNSNINIHVKTYLILTEVNLRKHHVNRLQTQNQKSWDFFVKLK